MALASIYRQSISSYPHPLSSRARPVNLKHLSSISPLSCCSESSVCPGPPFCTSLPCHLHQPLRSVYYLLFPAHLSLATQPLYSHYWDTIFQPLGSITSSLLSIPSLPPHGIQSPHPSYFDDAIATLYDPDGSLGTGSDPLVPVFDIRGTLAYNHNNGGDTLMYNNAGDTLMYNNGMTAPVLNTVPRPMPGPISGPMPGVMPGPMPATPAMPAYDNGGMLASNSATPNAIPPMYEHAMQAAAGTSSPTPILKPFGAVDNGWSPVQYTLTPVDGGHIDFPRDNEIMG